MQICVTCKLDKEDTEYHRTGKNNLLRKECKSCVNEKRRAKRKENPEFFKQKDKENYIKHQEARKAAAKVYIIKNKDKVMKRKKEYYNANKEVLAEKHKQYYQDNKQELIEKNKSYYQNNKESILAKKKRYRASEQGRLVIRNNRNKYRALKSASSDGSVTTEALLDLASKQNYKCAYCGCDIDIKEPTSHLDHVLPLSKGGTHSITNVVWACAPCNLQKSATIINKKETND